MTERTFDTNQILTAAREAFAPMLKAQQEGFKTIERLARLRARAEEFATVTSEMQAKFSQFGSEIAAKAVPSRKAA